MEKIKGYWSRHKIDIIGISGLLSIWIILEMIFN